MDVGLQLWRADLGLEHPRIWVYAGGTWDQSPKDKDDCLVIIAIVRCSNHLHVTKWGKVKSFAYGFEKTKRQNRI